MSESVKVIAELMLESTMRAETSANSFENLKIFYFNESATLKEKVIAPFFSKQKNKREVNELRMKRRLDEPFAVPCRWPAAIQQHTSFIDRFTKFDIRSMLIRVKSNQNPLEY